MGIKPSKIIRIVKKAIKIKNPVIPFCKVLVLLIKIKLNFSDRKKKSSIKFTFLENMVID